MYAIIREWTSDTSKPADPGPALAQARALHEKQPGYVGSLVIEDGPRLIAVNIWDTEQAAAAGRNAIGPQVQRLLEPLMAGRSRLIGAGEVHATRRRWPRRGRRGMPL